MSDAISDWLITPAGRDYPARYERCTRERALAQAAERFGAVQLSIVEVDHAAEARAVADLKAKRASEIAASNRAYGAARRRSGV